MAQLLVNGKNLPQRQAGFAYLLVLMLIVVMGLGLGAAGTLWRTESQRVKEQQLLYIGEQYRKAISSYYAAPSPEKQYPKSLDDLLLDPRQTVTTRHLRKLYADPVTGDKAWGLVVDPDSQQIRGVYSLAPGKPLKQQGFASHQQDFEDAETYATWRFVVTAATVPAPSPNPAATPIGSPHPHSYPQK